MSSVESQLPPAEEPSVVLPTIEQEPDPPNSFSSEPRGNDSLDASIFTAIQNCDCSSIELKSEPEVTFNLTAETTKSALESTDISICKKISKISIGDGSDSGVDIETNLAFQRALSSNSGGYASSSGGLDEPAGNVSCNSSMISFCSDINCSDVKTVNAILLRNTSGHDCTSEGGSESSSVTGGPTISPRRTSMKKKVAVITEPTSPCSSLSKSIHKDDNSVAKSRSRAASANRAAAAKVTNGGAPMLTTRDRARSRDKITSKNSTKQMHPQNRSTPIKRPNKPDFLPTGISKELPSPAIQRVASVARTPSITRGRTPGCTPTIEDGRWPSLGTKTGAGTPKSTRAGSATPENLVIKTKIGNMSLDLKSIDKYATLPRRRKEKSDEDLRSHNYRSTSAQRDQRMTTSFVKRQVSMKESASAAAAKTSTLRRNKTIPKTRIYHETSVQTMMTCKDVADAFAGCVKEIKIDAIETVHQEVQVDIRDREIEKLQEQLRKATSDNASLQETINARSKTLLSVEQQLKHERNEKQEMTKELQNNTERIIRMLSKVQTSSSSLTTSITSADENCDSLLMLESQIQLSGHALEQKQSEINKLHLFCKKLQGEMQRSVYVQRSLIEEKEVFEKESTELQDFLQDEKATLVDALKEAENECERLKEKFTQKDVDIERLQEECRHLVRISEQRRQEYLGIQSKYSALESRSKELIVQQGSAVSGATLALAGLGTRLDSLVDQLISSYNISEQELEDVVFHNEAYTNSSGEGSPDYDDGKSKLMSDGSLSPQRNQSFIAAVINAIKSAAKQTVSQTNKKNSAFALKNGQETEVAQNNLDDESDSTEMLDSETEPCLMMENVLEDVAMPDSHSHNMVSSTGLLMSQSSHIELPVDVMDKEQQSIHNLSQAIANRQKIELQTSLLMRNNSEHSTSEDISIHESIAEIPSISEYYSAQTLVDQVIDVDNLVTKLLKVLRIIQMDNDNCIQQLIGDKNSLQLNKEEQLEKLKDWEELNLKLKIDLEDAMHQLTVNGSDLANSKIELQRHRTEIDRLNVDICQLSTLCSSQNTTKSKSKDDILKAIKMWQENKCIPEPEIVAHIVSACQEIPILKEKLLSRQLNTNLSNSPKMLGNNWQESAISETKRQYEAIDRALETLSNIQSIVEQCPALGELQRDLEETNFQSAATIPIYTALLSAAAVTNGSGSNNGPTENSDCNANAAATNGVSKLKSEENNSAATVDSTA